MTQGTSIAGSWWLPGKREWEIPGTLIYNDDNPTILSLSGPFESFLNMNLWHTEEDFVMQGESSEGKKITVTVTSFKNQRDSLGPDAGQTSCELYVQFVFLGFHFNSQYEIKFQEVLVRYSELDKWIGLYHESELPIRAEIKGICTIEIVGAHSIPGGSNDVRKIGIYKELYVKFRANNKSLSNYIEVKSVFHDFLNFIITNPVTIDSIQARPDKIDSEALVTILYRSTRSDKMSKPRVLSNYLLYYEKVKEDFPRIMQDWFSMENKFRIVQELYFGEMYNTELYLNLNFLMLVQALEEYHRISKGDITDQHDLYQEIYKKVLPFLESLPNSTNDVSSEEIVELKKLIKRGMQPNMRTRVEELYDKFSDILPYLSIMIGNKKCFALKVTQYRNAFSHGSLGSEKTEMSDLFWLYKDIQLLLQLCLLSELHFSNDSIKEIYHVNNMKEIMDHKKKTAIKSVGNNMELLLSWLDSLIDRCDFPPSFNDTPENLLQIIKNVDSAIGKDMLESLSETEKNKLFDNIYSNNRMHIPNLDSTEVTGISLALWSGCKSGCVAISDEANGGPNINLRDTVFLGLEKISNERPIYGRGVEMAPLWKKQVELEENILMKDAPKHYHIRRYERLIRPQNIED